MLRGMGRTRFLGFSPARIFSGGAAGAWYDPSDLASAWQESAGTTPGAINSPVGKRDDKSGNVLHLLQATAAARFVLSARVNLLTKTEQFDHADWAADAYPNPAVVSPDAALSPIGNLTADQIAISVITAARRAVLTNLVVGVSYTFKCYVKQAPAGSATHFRHTSNNTVAWDTGASTKTLLTSDWQEVSATWTQAAGAAAYLYIGGLDASGVYDADCAGNVLIWGADCRPTADFTQPYQRVNTASDYDTAGFPLFDAGDGVDDGYAATFSAGTLTADMDCFMAIKRNAATGLVAAFRAAGSANYFGSMTSGGAGATSAASGTPTIWVDGVQVTNTEGDLHTAMTVGAWHVLEVRNLDLSAYVGFGQGYFSGGYPGSASFGGTVMAPAQSDAVRAQVRRYLAGKVGAAVV